MTDELARALDTLFRLRVAATPLAATRIAEVSTLLQRLANEQEQLASRVRSLENRSMEIPVLDTGTLRGRPSREARLLAADLGEEVPDDPESNSPGLLAALGAIGAGLAETPAMQDDRLGTSVLPGNDAVEGAMPGAEAILPRYRVLLRPLLNALHDETSFGTRARNRVDELLDLLDALERLNAIRRGLVVVHPIVFNPAELLRQTRRTMGPRAAAKDQTLVMDTETAVPSVVADGDLSQEVLDALVDNAIRYTDYGGEIRVTAESVGGDILFTISDTGVGLEPDDLEKIGTPFFRSSLQPIVQTQTGAGLRLFIARQLLDVQGGELFFSGEPGMGASFSFTLPSAGK